MSQIIYQNIDKIIAAPILITFSLLIRYALVLFGQRWITTISHTVTLVFLPLITYVITKVISNNYSEKREGPKYEMPIFMADKDGSSSYKLVVTFPGRDQFVFSSILSVAGLSFF